MWKKATDGPTEIKNAHAETSMHGGALFGRIVGVLQVATQQSSIMIIILRKQVHSFHARVKSI
jgi:hypothetical protein